MKAFLITFVIVVIIVSGFVLIKVPGFSVNDEGASPVTQSASQASHLSKTNEDQEKIINWILPTQINCKQLDNVLAIENSSIQLIKRIWWFKKLDTDEIGIWEIAGAISQGEFNGGGSFKQLLRFTDTEIVLLKSETVTILNKTNRKQEYENDNVLYKSPNITGPAHWTYIDKESEVRITCKSYFDSIKIEQRKTKVLIIESRMFNTEDSTSGLFSIDKKYYLKGKGLYRIDEISRDGVKLLMKFLVSDSKFDKNAVSSTFPLFTENNIEK